MKICDVSHISNQWDKLGKALLIKYSSGNLVYVQK